MKSLVTISSETVTDNVKENFIKHYKGILEHKGQITHFSYMDEGIFNELIIDTEENSVSLRRNHDERNLILYKEKLFTECMYETPFGKMPLQFKTEKIHIKNSKRLFAELIYFIFQQGREISRVHLTISENEGCK